jgi:hypothetical protein
MSILPTDARSSVAPEIFNALFVEHRRLKVGTWKGRYKKRNA